MLKSENEKFLVGDCAFTSAQPSKLNEIQPSLSSVSFLGNEKIYYRQFVYYRYDDLLGIQAPWDILVVVAVWWGTLNYKREEIVKCDKGMDTRKDSQTLRLKWDFGKHKNFSKSALLTIYAFSTVHQKYISHVEWNVANKL